MSGLNSEVVQCPNCNEKVPKTLYCLNCGYPLYKAEQEPPKEPEPKAETPPEEAKTEPVEAQPAAEPEKPAEVTAPEPVEEEKEPEPTAAEPLPQAEEVKEPEAEPPVEQAPEKVEEPPEQPETEPLEPEHKEVAEEPAPEEVKEPEPVAAEPAQAEEAAPEPEAAVEAIPDAHVEAPPEQAPEKQAEPQPTPAEEAPEPPQEGKVDMPSIIEDSSMVEAKAIGYVPDAYLKDVVENYAKNIAVKVKLIKVFREGAVKEETFAKLFENYSEAGKIWQARMSELSADVAAKLEELEVAYVEAEKTLELLEVRKAVGDASEEEYAVKQPAYRWEIDHLDYVMSQSRKKQAYLDALGNLIPEKEHAELKETASLLYNTVDALHVSNDELMTRVKETLYEAIKALG